MGKAHWAMGHQSAAPGWPQASGGGATGSSGQVAGDLGETLCPAWLSRPPALAEPDEVLLLAPPC